MQDRTIYEDSIFARVIDDSSESDLATNPLRFMPDAERFWEDGGTRLSNLHLTLWPHVEFHEEAKSNRPS